MTDIPHGPASRPQPEPAGDTREPDRHSPPAAEGRPRVPVVVRVLPLPLLLLLALGISQLPLLIPPLGRAAQTSEQVASWANVAGCLITFALVLLFVSLWIRFLDRRPLRATGWLWTRASGGLLLLGIGISLVIGVGLTVALWAVGALDRVHVNWSEIGARSIVLAIIVKLAQAFFLQGIPEELLFRGYLMQTMRERPKLALLVSTVFFGILHLASTGNQQNLGERFIYLLWPTGFGFCAAALVLRLQSLWPAIGIHAGSHVANLILQFTAINAGRPVTWIAVGLAYFLVGALILRGVDWQRPVSLHR